MRLDPEKLGLPVTENGQVSEKEAVRILREPIWVEVFTEGEDWRGSPLGVLNAILDTVLPGMRMTVLCNPISAPPKDGRDLPRERWDGWLEWVRENELSQEDREAVASVVEKLLEALPERPGYLGLRLVEPVSRPRNLPLVLRELADQIEDAEAELSELRQEEAA